MKCLIHERWGGTPRDVKKTASSTDDDVMCWAAAASNILAWTGWGFPPQEPFADENAIFNYFLDHWADKAGFPARGWEWWFDGHAQTDVETPGGGFWEPPYAFADHYRVEWDRAKALTAICDDVDHGYGMVLDLVSQQGGHVITCWGYEQADDSMAVGIYTTDSDDPVAGLHYYPLHQDTSGQDEWGHYKDWWYFTYRDGMTRFLIGAVHALDRAAVGQNTPRPPTGLQIS
jgi:hypothetical protein